MATPPEERIAALERVYAAYKERAEDLAQEQENCRIWSEMGSNAQDCFILVFLSV